MRATIELKFSPPDLRLDRIFGKNDPGRFCFRIYNDDGTKRSCGTTRAEAHEPDRALETAKWSARRMGYTHFRMVDHRKEVSLPL